jgi:hypothetical protein
MLRYLVCSLRTPLQHTAMVTYHNLATILRLILKGDIRPGAFGRSQHR